LVNEPERFNWNLGAIIHKGVWDISVRVIERRRVSIIDSVMRIIWASGSNISEHMCEHQREECEINDRFSATCFGPEFQRKGVWSNA
jgi:hypothetical protein